MRDPYWHDESHALYAGDPRQVLAEMPAGSADCIVTSPPPWRPQPCDTAADTPSRYGREPTPALYLAALRRLFAQAHRVLSEQGTAWLITSDRYAGQTGWDGPPEGRHRRRIRDQAMTGVPAASLIGLPWRLAFALQDDGWIVRNVIVWSQPTMAMTSAADRLALSYELILLLVKTNQYTFDRDAIRRPLDRLITELGLGHNPSAGQGRASSAPWCGGQHIRRHLHRRGSGQSGKRISDCRTRRRAASQPRKRHDREPLPLPPVGDVWSLPPRPQRQTLPIEVPLACIATGCQPGGTVLDMFAADATTGLAARRLGRSFIGVEQNPELCRIAEQRLRGDSRHQDGDA